METTKSKVNVQGAYWTGTLDDTPSAFYLYLGPDNNNNSHTWGVSIRSTGRAVRAVMD
ncbi:MAG: hypothetical protein IKZ71_01855 [Bacteroidales bacterium]|nr:hypothetical protein [Bacteroidales bacterium]